MLVFCLLLASFATDTSLTVGLRDSKFTNEDLDTLEGLTTKAFATHMISLKWLFMESDFSEIDREVTLCHERRTIPFLAWDMSSAKDLHNDFVRLPSGAHDAYIQSFVSEVNDAFLGHESEYLFIALGTELNSPENYWVKDMGTLHRCILYVVTMIRKHIKVQNVEFVLPLTLSTKVDINEYFSHDMSYRFVQVTMANFGPNISVSPLEMFSLLHSMLPQDFKKQLMLLVSTVSNDDTEYKITWIKEVFSLAAASPLSVRMVIYDNIETNKDTGIYKSSFGDLEVAVNNNGVKLFSYSRLGDAYGQSFIESYDVSSGNSHPDDIFGDLCIPGYGYDSSLQTCALCTKGTYSSGGTRCRLCPVNTYQDKRGASSCISCSSNMITVGTGASSPGECVCGIDTFYDKELGACYKCPTGFYAPLNSRSCTQCPVPNCMCNEDAIFDRNEGQCLTTGDIGGFISSSPILLSALMSIALVIVVFVSVDTRKIPKKAPNVTAEYSVSST